MGRVSKSRQGYSAGLPNQPMKSLRLLILLALTCAESAAGQGRRPVADDSTIYRVIIDSLFPKGDLLLVRQLYSHGSTVRDAPAGTLQGMVAPSPRIAWIDSNAVVTTSPDGRAVLRFAVQLTRPTYVADGRTAIVYVRDVCGGLCGSEREVVIVQDWRGRWRVAGVVTTAVY